MSICAWISSLSIHTFQWHGQALYVLTRLFIMQGLLRCRSNVHELKFIAYSIDAKSCHHSAEPEMGRRRQCQRDGRQSTDLSRSLLDNGNGGVCPSNCCILSIPVDLIWQLRWSYGVRLLSTADPEAVEELPASPPIDTEETAYSNSSGQDHVIRHQPSLLSDVDDSKTLTQTRVIEDPKSTSSSRSFSPLPQPQASTSGAPSMFADEYDDDDEDLLVGRHVTEPTSSAWQSRVRRTRNSISQTWGTIYDFMTVPLWAALASLVVACIQPLQHILEVHIQPVKGALTAAGNCSIPLTLVVLGAYFYTPPEKEDLPRHKSLSRSASRTTLYDQMCDMFSLKRRDAERAPARKTSRPGETRTVVVAVLSRMVITPLLLLPLLALAAKYDVQQVFEEYVPMQPSMIWTIVDLFFAVARSSSCRMCYSSRRHRRSH